MSGWVAWVRSLSGRSLPIYEYMESVRLKHVVGNVGHHICACGQVRPKEGANVALLLSKC